MGERPQAMTIGIQIVRDQPDLVRDSEKRRLRDGKIVDEVLEIDKEWRSADFNVNQQRKEIGIIQKGITEKKKESKGQDECLDELAEKKKCEEKLAELEQVAKTPVGEERHKIESCWQPAAHIGSSV